MSIQVNDFRWEPGKNDAEYIKQLESSRDNWKRIAQKAISKLKMLSKAKQPRVLTLDEVRSKQIKAIPIWKDTKSKNKALYVGWVLAYEKQTGQGITGDCLGMAEPSGRMVWYKLSDYGKTWRVWSARPTDAQREAVKWDDDTNPYL